MKQSILSILIAFISISAYSQTWSSDYAKPDGSGCLTYKEDENLNRIPDFSYAGYKGGGVAIPDVATVLTISPIAGDNTQHIQDAIDAVAAMQLGDDGFRGAVLLTAGTYNVNGQLYINADGVVLRGEGDGRGDGNNTIIMGIGNTPEQRNLITIGGGTGTRWSGQVSGTKQDITSDFVQVGSHSFDVADASVYSEGDNIIIYHPCTDAWLAAIDYGGPNGEPDWVEGAYPIIFNRYITGISGNTITIDAPVYNHLDRSLSQSYIYTYDREGIITNVGIENLTIDNEYTGIAAYSGEEGITDEAHVRNSVQLTQVEDAWVQNCTMMHFVLSGVRMETASRVTVRNTRSWDPIAVITGGRMYNFNLYACSNNILFDNCHARNGRHNFVSNGISMVSGFVVLRSISENPYTASEGHRHWTTGMLFDNLRDIGRVPRMGYSMAFYNRGDMGSSHGWSAAHSVFWGCNTTRVGSSAEIIVEQPPTGQNWAIGCFGTITGDGPFEQPDGYIEGSNRYDAVLEPASLYEAQLLCRKDAVIADFNADVLSVQNGESVTFTADVQGTVSDYIWDFGAGAEPLTATGAGPHIVKYASVGEKTISLTVNNGTDSHTESKLSYIEVVDNGPVAVNDLVATAENESVNVAVLKNDTWSNFPDNYALEFDGIDDNVVYEGGAVNLYPFTMMAWIKTASSTEDVVLYVGNGSSGVTGNTLGINNGVVQLQSAKYDGTSTRETIKGTIAVNDGEWHHIVGVFESPTSRRVYVDGVLDGSSAAEIDVFSGQTINKTAIGNREDATPSNYFTGAIDNAKIITTPLSDSEVIEYMNNSRAGDKSNTILSWMFDEGAGTSVNDESSNEFSGIIDGATWIASDLTAASPMLKVIDGPKHGTYAIQDQEIIYIPESDYNGYDSIQYSITDNTGFTSSAKVILTVGTIYPCEVPDLGETINFCGMDSYTLQSNLDPTNRTFEWFKDGVLIENENDVNLTITAPGLYSVIADSLGCETPDEVLVDDKLMVNLGDDFHLCNPSSAFLDAGNENVPNVIYTWSTGEDSQTISVLSGGEYTVEVSALGCETVSDIITITSSLLDVTGDHLEIAGTATISVNGTSEYNWYENLEGGEPVFTGTVYQPEVSETTTFYVEDANGSIVSTGIETPGTSGYFRSITSNYVFFDVYKDITLNAITIKSENAQTLTITITDNSGNSVGAVQASVDAGVQEVQLGIDIPAGTNYRIDADDATEKLFVGGAPLGEYPYTIDGVISIHSSDPTWLVGNGNYPFWYNWKISVPNECGRTPVLVTVESAETEQTIQLSEGWNLVSLYVHPVNRLTGNVFQNATIVKTMDGFYDSSQPEFLNSLTTIEAGKGYLVYNSIDETITISGIAVETHGRASLQDGWNLIGVPSSVPIPVSNYPEALIIKDFESFYKKDDELSTLIELEPGKAYFIFK